MTSPLPAAFDNRVSRDLGVDIPIVQAPMGWIARSQLASAVSQAGACGIIETSSGELDAVKDEIRKMRDLTDRPFGVNIAQAFVRDPAIAEFVIDQGVKFVTTSAGSPTKYTGVLKEAGLTVYHVVPTLAAALKAVDAGVDGMGEAGPPGVRLELGQAVEQRQRAGHAVVGAVFVVIPVLAGERSFRPAVPHHLVLLLSQQFLPFLIGTKDLADTFVKVA